VSRPAEDQSLNLEITGRHLKVTPALRAFAGEKLAKIRRLVDGPLEFHVILTVEKHRHAAEIVAHGRNLNLSAREITQDMYTSIGECVEKLESQARKHKEKYATRRRRANSPKAANPDEEATASARKSKARAVDRSHDPDFAPRITRSGMRRRKPMSVEEAVLEVMDTDASFVVFRNDRSQKVNVLYRRKDGSFGLIDPED
jgi:putative sigma-54 modulation protein